MREVKIETSEDGSVYVEIDGSVSRISYVDHADLLVKISLLIGI